MNYLYLSPSVQEWNRGIGGVTEEAVMQALGRAVAGGLSPLINIRMNRPEMTLTEIVNDSNKWYWTHKKDKMATFAHLALHTNANAGLGYEIWAAEKSTNGNLLAGMLERHVTPALGLPLRKGRKGPIKYPNIDLEHGLAEIDDTMMPACIIELGSHDKEQSDKALKDNWEKVTHAIQAAIHEYFGVVV